MTDVPRNEFAKTGSGRKSEINERGRGTNDGDVHLLERI